MIFQITESFGKGSFSYLYIDCEPDEKTVCKTAIEAVKRSFDENDKISWFGAKGARPTLHIVQYDGNKKRKVRSGLKFKTTWR